MKGKEKIITSAIALLCILSAAVYFLIPGETGKYAVISQDGKTVMKKSLSEEGTFTCPEIPHMKFEISGEGIRVTESDCPDKICVKTGFVSREGEAAVCMPNRVIITVEGDDDEKQG